MSVEFDEGGGQDNGTGTRVPSYMAAPGEVEHTSGVTRLLMKMKLAKDQQGANRAMVIIAILAFVLTACVIAYQFGLFSRFTTAKRKIIYKEDIPEVQRESLPPGFYNSLPSRNKK